MKVSRGRGRRLYVGRDDNSERGKRHGPRNFRVAAAFVWNNLPRHLRNNGISREQFARDLKTFLFARVPIRQRRL